MLLTENQDFLKTMSTFYTIFSKKMIYKVVTLV